MVESIKKYKEVISLMFVYWLICLLMFFLDVSCLYFMLSWNVLLAVLPLLFISMTELSITKGKPVFSIFWMLAWLFFFPNSVYLITDFIHITRDEFMRIAETGRYTLSTSVVYSNNILIWMKLLIIGVGFFFSLLVGLESFYIFEQNIKVIKSKHLASLGVLIASVLSATGVYIGRFLRFNSWDVLFNPIQLIIEVTSAMNIFTFQFITAFTVFVILCFITYKIFRKIAIA